MKDFNILYKELVQITKQLEPYYDVDKIKPYAIYIWTKGEYGENVFDILTDRVGFYVKEHKIIEEAKPIITEIQFKLKEMEQYL